MRFTTRRLFINLIMLLLVACGGKSAEEQIASAQQYLAEEDYKAAAIELKNALQQDGQSAEARWLLGKLYLDTGDTISAEKELLRASAPNWDANDLRPALARAQLAQGNFAAVRELSHKELNPLAAAWLLSAQAQAALAQGEPAEAQKLVAKALEKQPDLVDAKIAEARILSSQGDLTGALIVLTDVLTQAPENGHAWSLQGDILLRQKNLTEALAAFNQSIELSPNNFEDRFKRALIELQTGDNAAAQSDADSLLKVAPQHPAANYVQGLLHFQNRKYPEAITALSLAEPAAKQFPLVLFYLGSSHLIEGHQDQAAVFAAQFFNIAPDNIPGRKLLAAIRLQQGKFGEVRELIQPVLDNNPEDIGAMNLMANAMLRDGETDQAINLLAKVAELQPDSAAAQVRLGAGLLLSGHNVTATEKLETALELSPEFQQADILLVLNHVQHGNFEEAIKAAKAYRRRNLTSVTPYNLLGRVYLAQGSNKEARESFEKALSLDPADPAANHNLAQMALLAGDAARARQYYAVILEQQPDSLPTLLQLAILDAREQNEESLVKNLQLAMKAHPDALAPRLMLGRYYLGKGKPEQVAPLFSSLGDIQKQSPEVLQLTAMAQLSGQQHSDAQITLEQLIASTASTPSTHHMLAMAAAGGGENARAKEELQQAIALDGDYLPSLLALAKLALAEQTQAEFDKYMQKLVVLAPEAPDVLRLRAMAAQRDGDSATALEYASRAFKETPTTQTMLELAGYQKLAGNKLESLQLMQQWAGDNPQDITARLALANDLHLAEKVATANSQYEAILEQDPDNLIALNNLAWFLRLEAPEMAMTYIQHAANLAPERPDVLDTLAVIQHLNGENRRAHRNIQRALVGAPGNPSMIYHRAMIEVALGDKDAARVSLEGILDDGAAKFPEQAEAWELLETL